eukprot:2793187-Pyramimonas_sp.AAC.1
MSEGGHNLLVESEFLVAIIQQVCELLKEGAGWAAAPRAAATMVALFNALVEQGPDHDAITAMLTIPKHWSTTCNAAIRGVAVSISVLARSPNTAAMIMKSPTKEVFYDTLQVRFQGV